jgi:hypothetical protein
MVFPVVGGNQSSGDLITNSLRFNSADSPELTKTFGSAGGDTWSYSCWLKRGDISEQGHGLLKANTNAGLYFLSTGALVINDDGASAHTSTELFRDVGAWYHILFTGNGTTNKVYVNNVQLTFSGGTPNIGDINNNVAHSISKSAVGVEYMDGYLADIHFVDGTEKAPTDFAETNDNGVWVPIKYTGSYGTNGFHLEFKQTGTSANAAGIGADTSGNGNHFAVSNLAATDIGIDTPQNNYCTINSIYADDGNNMIGADFTEGNRKQLTTVDGWKFGRGTFLLEAGKWYVEVKMTEAGSGQVGNFGIVPSQGGVALGNTDDNDVFEGLRVSFSSSDTNLQKLDTGSGSNIFTDFASGNTAMLAIDLDNDKIWIGKEGTWYNNNNASTTLDPSNHDIALPTVSLGWAFGLGATRNGSDNVTFEYNWGNPAHAISSGNSDADGHGNFEFAVPSGFFAVNSKNLAEYG